jgi:hypothetical protein
VGRYAAKRRKVFRQMKFKKVYPLYRMVEEKGTG